MAKYTLIPTQKIILQARNKNMNPYEYLDDLTFSIPRDAKYDARRMDKFQIEYFQDIMITRDDKTRVIIHELYSDIDYLKKVELSEVDSKNRIVKTITAYTEGLDFSKMQSEQDYLDVLGNLLISQERIASKEALAKNYDLDEIYIGTIRRSKETHKYAKAATKSDNTMLASILATKRDNKIKHEQEMLLAQQEKLKKNMIAQINDKLKSLSIEDLQVICDSLGIDSQVHEQENEK